MNDNLGLLKFSLLNRKTIPNLKGTSFIFIFIFLFLCFYGVCVSEPPDVGNWFSTYEYRTPDPDSNFSFRESALRACESQRDAEREGGGGGKFEKITTRDEVVAKEKLVQCRSTSVEDDKHNEDTCLKEVQLLLKFSILNWTKGVFGYRLEGLLMDCVEVIIVMPENVF